MKHLVFGAAILLIIFATVGCTDSPQWEETTLTIVNDSGEEVDTVYIFAFGLSRATTTTMNALGDESLSDGESESFPLPPVLAGSGAIQLNAAADITVFTFYYDDTIWPNPDDEDDRTKENLYFWYEEGAEITIHLTSEMEYTIDGATVLSPADLVF